jgi:hypothetical protein
MAALIGTAVAGIAILLAGPVNAKPAEAAQATAVAPSPGPWGSASEAPGLAELNANGRAEVLSVSCGQAGTCAAGGSYTDGNGSLQGFVVSQQDGTWGNAITVPGLAAMNKAGFAEVLTVSCGPAGTCAAGGYFYDRRNHQQAFVVGEQNGTWGNAIAVPGLAKLSLGFAEVLTVSCDPTGGCSGGGYYYDRHGQQGFVVSEQNGTWGKAIEVPGLAALNTGFKGLDAVAQVSSVSCDSAGDCAAGGFYQDRLGHGQAFMTSERHGTWGKAVKPPGVAALNAGGSAGFSSLSCISPGNCGAGGYYKDGKGHGQGFVASERHGTWGKAIAVPGLAALTKTGGRVYSVACTSAANCAASGGYTDVHSHGQGFVVSKLNGTWGKAIEVPGLGALNAGHTAKAWSVSCGSTGNCAAGGGYTDRRGNQQGFVVSEQNGTWGKAIEVPGLQTLNAGVAQVWSVSCGQASTCIAGGYYQDSQRHVQGFIAGQTGPQT